MTNSELTAALEGTLQIVLDVQRRLGPLTACECYCGSYSREQYFEARSCMGQMDAMSFKLRWVLQNIEEQPIDVEIVERLQLPQGT